MLVAVGSQNPVKIESVRLAFVTVWPAEDWAVRGCSVASGVADQPMTDDEARQGARTRAVNAIATLNADYGVGLEGGLQQLDDLWFNSGWVHIVDANGRLGIGSTLKMIVPPALMKLVLAGHELGHACDLLFDGTNTKQGIGHFGLMTDNAIHRTGAFRDAVIAALASFLHPELSR
jgi:inosine/xanthosine triphosphatase